MNHPVNSPQPRKRIAMIRSSHVDSARILRALPAASEEPCLRHQRLETRLHLGEIGGQIVLAARFGDLAIDVDFEMVRPVAIYARLDADVPEPLEEGSGEVVEWDGEAGFDGLAGIEEGVVDCLQGFAGLLAALQERAGEILIACVGA